MIEIFHRIQHCFREVNQRADSLARIGAELDVDFISFDVPPDCVLDQIRLDALGTLYCRRFTSSSSSLWFLSNNISSLPKKKKKKKKLIEILSSCSYGELYIGIHPFSANDFDSLKV